MLLKLEKGHKIWHTR